jgi:glucose-6-phosphate isomerase
MTPAQLWQRYQDYFVSVPLLDISLDISRMNFSSSFLKKMEPKMQQAFAAMSALEKGSIANPDEKRMVGHYWLRDPEIAPTREIRFAITETLKKIKHFTEDVHDGKIVSEQGSKFTNLLVIGIGGSALGPQFVAQALSQPARDKLRVWFFDNSDPEGMDYVISQIEKTREGLAGTLTIVISKSGGTKETRNGQLEAKAAYKKAGLCFEKHVVAITGEGSELSKVAKKNRWIVQFPMWDWVGGRTSELSAVGLLPAALQGFPIDDLLSGARLMDVATRSNFTRHNPAALLALMWFYATDGKGSKDMVVLPYKDRLLLFSRYLQQLVMESLGKEKNLKGKTVHQGISVYGNKGSTDQHAYIQQLRDGVPNFFATFIEVLKDREGPSFFVEPGITSGDYLEGFLQGTRRALYENGRESITLTLHDTSATSIGALIALYERAVGFYGFLVGINAYHQPGVEAGKKAATSVIALQEKALAALKKAKGKHCDAEQIAKTIGAKNEAESVYQILRHLAANRDRKIHSDGSPPSRAIFWMEV